MVEKQRMNRFPSDPRCARQTWQALNCNWVVTGLLNKGLKWCVLTIVSFVNIVSSTWNVLFFSNLQKIPLVSPETFDRGNNDNIMDYIFS